ncbi:DUF1428 domain-containing protein [Haliangium ochraceum]|uniref:RNA signal recognition particle 4.5S RNA n=1 Tax=Haliangium ochraceum (strain DSM 14365 / JCM 11303 / SMP-2) TaxID=502025 RepID=D0LSP9_HALO1|nr:DUF1428 domain-containing protein [Haliangium ochraceum]ACY17271.1 protein of unknown function DUF1428 [Haliangium ochraceum DSM 14365]
MSYVDGFIIPVPRENKEAYRKLAAEMLPMFRELGALQVIECWGDDLPAGEHTDFRRSVKAEEGENVVFSWIVWPSKEVRDVAQQKMMDDPRMDMGDDMPMDTKRMIFGGFTVLVDSDNE